MELEFVNLTSSITPSPRPFRNSWIQGRNVPYKFQEQTRFFQRGREPFVGIHVFTNLFYRYLFVTFFKVLLKISTSAMNHNIWVINYALCITEQACILVFIMSETKLEFLGVAKTVRRSLAVPDILLRVSLSPAEYSWGFSVWDLKNSSI